MASVSKPRAIPVDRPDRAVIDIGSNTVRLVVYSGSRRAPSVWLNEKVTARLGRELATSGKMPDKAMDLALSGLSRFALILRDLEVDDVQCVATAAVRDASNGAAFLERVRDLGLAPRLLSGEEEARYSALGVIGAFPGGAGLVADLGGGSIELVSIAGGQCHDGASLPLGTLRLPALRAKGEAAFRKTVAKELEATALTAAPGQPLYLVGGTWRAFAAFAINRLDYPLSDPHSFRLEAEEAVRLTRRLMDTPPEELAGISGVPSSRAAGLPDAAALLQVLIAVLQPASLVISAWGLREGLLFDRLEPAAREADPLIAAVSHFAAPRGGDLRDATMTAGWTARVVTPLGNGAERLRLAAILLAKAQTRLEPNMRLKHSFDWAMDKRWIGIDHRGRALIGAALRGACGKPDPTADLLRLASEAELREAAAWGLAFRLCRRIGAGTRASMLTSRLEREEGRLVLWLDAGRAQLASDLVRADLKALAGWLGCTPDLRIGQQAAG